MNDDRRKEKGKVTLVVALITFTKVSKFKISIVFIDYIKLLTNFATIH